MIDYRKILMEYIVHVGIMEGADYLEPYYGMPDLTNDEKLALQICRDEAWAKYEPKRSPGHSIDELIRDIPMPTTPLMAAARKGVVQGTTPFPGFKEGQIVTGKGLKPSVVTIAKNGKVVLVPKDE